MRQVMRQAATGRRFGSLRTADIEVFDEYTDEIVCLAPGLLIEFRYVSRDDEVSRRSLLCWQCGRNGKRIYVQGRSLFCGLRSGAHGGGECAAIARCMG
jgi:hypothetical protein